MQQLNNHLQINIKKQQQHFIRSPLVYEKKMKKNPAMIIQFIRAIFHKLTHTHTHTQILLNFIFRYNKNTHFSAHKRHKLIF